MPWEATDFWERTQPRENEKKTASHTGKTITAFSPFPVFSTGIAIPFFSVLFQKGKLGPNLQPSSTQSATPGHPCVEGEVS